MSKRTRTILLTLLVLFLTGAAVFLGYQIYQTSQAPQDSSASVWCANQPQCPVGQRVDFGGPACIVWRNRPSSACSPLNECYASNECGASEGQCGQTTTGYCLNVTSACSSSFRVEVHIQDANGRKSDAECIGTTQLIESRNINPGGSICANTITNQCDKCVQIDFIGASGGAAYYTGECTPEVPEVKTCYRCTSATNDGNTCESFTVNGNTCPTGSTDTPGACSQAISGGQCPVDVEQTDLICYRCTPSEVDSNTCESETRTEAQGCRPGWTTNSNCAAAAGGQCPVIACGDGRCQSGETCERINDTTSRQCLTNNGEAPTGPIVSSCIFSGPNACRQVAEERDLSLIKNSTGVCLVNGGQQITYSILMTNTGDDAVSHSAVQDRILTSLPVSVVSGLNNGGTVLASGSGIQITWPAASLAIGASRTYTYVVTLTAAQTEAASYELNNEVSVSYNLSDPTPVEITYTHKKVLQLCSTGALPSTGIREDIMYLVAVMLFILAVFVYRKGYGADQIKLAVNRLARINRKSRFEQDVLSE